MALAPSIAEPPPMPTIKSAPTSAARRPPSKHVARGGFSVIPHTRYDAPYLLHRKRYRYRLYRIRSYHTLHRQVHKEGYRCNTYRDPLYTSFLPRYDVSKKQSFGGALRSAIFLSKN